jgi:hypothetical protein
MILCNKGWSFSRCCQVAGRDAAIQRIDIADIDHFHKAQQSVEI